MVKTALMVAAGGALGSVLRYLASVLVAQRWGSGALPWATAFVNVAGSFLIGLAFVLISERGRFALDSDLRLLILVGICGGFTTFSTFSQQTLQLLEQGRMSAALFNIAGSVCLCLLAVWAGHRLGGLING